MSSDARVSVAIRGGCWKGLPNSLNMAVVRWDILPATPVSAAASGVSAMYVVSGVKQ